MSFAQGSSTIKSVFGNKRVHFGAFTQESGDTGGVVNTGLRVVECFLCTGMNTHSKTGGAVTVTTLNPGASQAGFWLAIGY